MPMQMQMQIEYLLLPLGVVLTTGLMMLRLSWQHMRRVAESEPARERLSPGGFGCAWDHVEFQTHGAARWLAVRGTDLAEVQQALRLVNPTPCTWKEGLARRDENRLVLSAPVAGWILVVGNELPDPAEDVDACFLFLRRLSGQLGEVHYYEANRVLHHHAWVRMEWGCVVRAYAWARRTLWNQGSITAAETKLGLVCRDYGQEASLDLHGAGGNPTANEERVFQLAACWSIDPTRIAEHSFRGASGLSGGLGGLPAAGR